MKEVNQEMIDKLGKDITDLIDWYKDSLMPYEIGHQLISQAVSMMLWTAPSHLVAFKTVMACVEIGIVDYQQTHEEKEV